MLYRKRALESSYFFFSRCLRNFQKALGLISERTCQISIALYRKYVHVIFFKDFVNAKVKLRSQKIGGRSK